MKIKNFIIFFLLLMSCSSDGNDVIKFSTEYDVGSIYRDDVEISVVLSKYGNKIYSSIKIDLGESRRGYFSGTEYEDFYEDLCDVEIFVYDKNGTKFDFGDDIYIDECDIVGIENKSQMIQYIMEGTDSNEYENEIYGFESIEYIVIEYGNFSDDYRRTEKIKKKFF